MIYVLLEVLVGDHTGGVSNVLLIITLESFREFMAQLLYWVVLDCTGVPNKVLTSSSATD